MNNTPKNTIQAGRTTPASAALKPRRRDPVLRFAPLAWLKLKAFLHADHVEVGGFGISAADDLLYIEDFQTVRQSVTIVSVEFDDSSVADYFDHCIDSGISLARCGRVWCHTHPASSPIPSVTDEVTFQRAFGQCDWAMMVIVARGGATYCRMNFSAGPGGAVEIPVDVDWERLPKDLLTHEGKLDEIVSEWMDEYGKNVHPQPDLLLGNAVATEPTAQRRPLHYDSFDSLDDFHDQSILDDDFASWAEVMEVYPWA